MEKNRRILTFSEFQKKYGKGSPYSKKTNMEGVELMKDAAEELSEPFIKGSKGDLDAISSKPATRKLKSDYEKTPSAPSDYNKDKNTTATGPIKTKKIENIEKEEVKDEEVKPKSTKKIKVSSKKSEEDKREEAADY